MINFLSNHLKHVLGTKMNRLIETVLLSTHNISMVRLRHNKMNFELPTHLNSKPVVNVIYNRSICIVILFS